MDEGCTVASLPSPDTFKTGAEIERRRGEKAINRAEGSSLSAPMRHVGGERIPGDDYPPNPKRLD